MAAEDTKPDQRMDLIDAIVERFVLVFAPGASVVYRRARDEDWAQLDRVVPQERKISVDKHARLPDVVIHDAVKNRLFLIDTITGCGPINAARHGELAKLFASAHPGIVYVTAFLTRREMARYLPEISWATEVWVADSETHLIHFNGERFLGPYAE